MSENKKIQVGYPEEQDLQAQDVRILRQLREQDERHAWDKYVAGILACAPDLFQSETMAKMADDMLVQRRKRFGVA